MLYRVRPYPEAEAQMAALPDDALVFFAQALSVLELVPWNGEAYNEQKPDGSMRQIEFGDGGRGLVIYLILEDQQLVDVLRVVWIG